MSAEVIQFKCKAVLEIEERINLLKESTELRKLDKTEVRIVLKNSQGFVRFLDIQRNLLRNEIRVPFTRAVIDRFFDETGSFEYEDVDLRFAFSGDFQDGMAIYSEILK